MPPFRGKKQYDVLLAMVPCTVTDFSWDAVVAQFPFLADLDKSTQDPIHHQEGDVGTHTRMVIRELLSDPAYAELSEVDRFKLFWAAVFHDSGKPATREEVDGRVTNRGHSKLGSKIARDHLRNAIVPFAIREEICAIILYHQQPFWLWEHDEKEQRRRAIQASLQLDPKLLIIHARADARGRICADPQGIVDYVALSESVYDDLKLLDGPFPFANDESRVAFFDHEDRDPYFAAHEEYRCSVKVMCGLPGSGKNWYKDRNFGHLPCIEMDAIRAEMGYDAEDNQGVIIQAAQARAKVLLAAKTDFVWNTTNITSDMRKKLFSILRDYNAHIEIVYVEATPGDLLKQNGDRKAAVPVDVINYLVRKLDPPVPWEAHTITHVLPDVLKSEPQHSEMAPSI
jgi:putative nucleotidyltransferase with HDIG domain